MKKSKGHCLVSILLFVLFLMPTFYAGAQTNCGCDITLTPEIPGSNYLYLDGTKLGIKPGYKICIKAGNYDHITLFNFQGTATQPLTFINCGGKVICGGTAGGGGITLKNCRYFKWTGTGDPANKYGFNVGAGSPILSTGVSMSQLSSDFEMDHIEVTNTQAGFFLTYMPDCDPTSWSTYFTMQNILLHDNWIHDTDHEGMYLGNTSMTYDITCNGVTQTVQPQHINNLKVYNNLLERTGWDGIQCSNAPVGLEVYNNTIRSYGAKNMQVQQAGIIIGGGTNGKVYNNFIDGGTGNAIQVLGVGTEQIYNNVIANAGYDGTTLGQSAIIIDDRPNPNPYPALQVQVVNNTIVSPKRDAVTLYNDYGTIGKSNVFENNIIVAPGAKYFNIDTRVTNTQLTNLTKPTVAEALFVNASAKDYHLQLTSPAVNTGTNAGSYGVTTDLDGNSRPSGSAYDIGAYEYGGTVPPPVNQPPVANAGPDQTITLPTNSVTLNGTASKDPDGTIASYKWTEVSGPTTFTLANASASSSALTNLVHGAYVFRLTVTDNAGATATDDVTINVAVATTNQVPVANAGSNVSITLPTNSTTLNGSASKDPDGSIASYAWTEVSGGNFTISNAAVVSPTVSGLTQGTYVFQLTVTDNLGAKASAQVTITVNAQAVVSTGIRTRVLIDAGLSTLQTTSPDAWGKYWNNMTDARAGVRVSNAVDSANRPTTISLEVINRIDGTFATSGTGTNGTNTTNNVGDYPASATNDFAFAHESTTTGKWRIFGLDANTTYTIKFWGSKSYASARIIKIKRSDQTAWQSYDAQMNTDYNRAAVFSVSGLTEVSFDIQVQSGQFGYINVLDIIGTSSGASARTANLATVVAPEKVDVTENISVYPNPSSSQTQLVVRNNYVGKVKLTVISTAGSSIQEFNVDKSGTSLTQKLTLSNLAAGVYYVRIQMGNELKVVKFVKE